MISINHDHLDLLLDIGEAMAAELRSLADDACQAYGNDSADPDLAAAYRGLADRFDRVRCLIEHADEEEG